MLIRDFDLIKLNINFSKIEYKCMLHLLSSSLCFISLVEAIK